MDQKRLDISIGVLSQETRDCTIHPITAIFDVKLHARRKATKSYVGMQLQTAWKPQMPLEISGGFSVIYAPPLERCNLRPPCFVTAVASSYWDAN